MNLKKTRFFLIISLLLIVLVSCEKDDTKNLQTDILSLWEFKGYQINGILEEIPDTISIDLYIGSIYSDGNDFEGESSYRNYWGRFKLDGENIELYDLRVTDVLSFNDSIQYYEIEKRYLMSLLKSDKYFVENNSLILNYGKDSCLIFVKSRNTIYDDAYELSAFYNGQNWESEPNAVSANLDRHNQRVYMFSIHSEPIIKYLDGNLYDLGITVYTPPKNGLYLQDGWATLDAYSFINGDPNTNRSESNSGYLKINRVSRKFVSGEFEFHMIHSGNQPNEFDITNGKFKAKLNNSSGLQWYIKY
ncbi:MAG: hypothetical protein JW866_07025 [Ignavibacteriales bacterium]|nr:hypothetical protein [Ignavibacteriales bacterium]